MWPRQTYGFMYERTHLILNSVAMPPWQLNMFYIFHDLVLVDLGLEIAKMQCNWIRLQGVESEA
jgi:hypothetical protein